ncbi:TetR family transcriptional regulator [Cumulibacter soli]|uniref:TetR family transcriptional regulator n=1 Tax=Cumulibacter soli TaxID=2546344 RepID=UPI00106859D2|nr:TetR family transcriptional regulator [Cumulibacter soli]
MAARGLNRDRLVAIAHEYVSLQGLDALTVRRLAAAAEVSPGALYKHFRDKRDIERAMADSVYAAVDLGGLDVAEPTAADVRDCCERLRAAILRFADGGRIVAGAYSPLPAAARVGATLRTLLSGLVAARYDTGDVAYVLRNYTVGFVIEEQAHVRLVVDGEWDSLVQTLRESGVEEPAGASHGVAILSDDRDVRFRAGLDVILAGVLAEPAED